MAVKATNQVSITDITDAYSVILTSEAYTFMGNTSGAPSGLRCTTQVVAYCGTNLCTKVTIGTITCPTGISATISNNNTSTPTITFKTTATVTNSCEAIIPVTVDGITINKKFSFSVAKTGATGATGSAGKGISSITNYYLATTVGSGVTTSTSGWTTTVQSITSSKRYLWNYEKITYTDNSTTNTTPAIIGVWGNTGSTGATGAAGADGADGRGISSITEYYLASASASGVTTSTSGWTTTMQSTTTSKKYLWNYEKIAYTDGTSSNSTVRIIGTHGATGAKGAAGTPGIDFSQGKMLFTDPMFARGVNSTSKYANSGSSYLTWTRAAKSSDNPMTGTSYEMVCTNTGAVSPANGGFKWGHASRANAIFIYRIIAKIPSGRSIAWTTNEVGTGSSSKWLTSNAGTGKFTEYLLRLECGSSGTFSSTGFFYVRGTAGTSSSPLKWYVAYATCFDMTNVSDVTTAQDTAEDAAKVATNYMNFDDDGLVIGDMTTSTLGKNILINSTSVNIRSGTSELARFSNETTGAGFDGTFLKSIDSDLHLVAGNLSNRKNFRIMSPDALIADGGAFISMEPSSATSLSDRSYDLDIFNFRNITLDGNVSVTGPIISSGTFNRGAWNSPTSGALTQIIDNTGSHHSVIVGRSSSGTRLYGMDLFDDTDKSGTAMRLYAGSRYLQLSSELSTNVSFSTSGSVVAAGGISTYGKFWSNCTNQTIIFGGTSGEQRIEFQNCSTAKKTISLYKGNPNSSSTAIGLWDSSTNSSVWRYFSNGKFRIEVKMDDYIQFDYNAGISWLNAGRIYSSQNQRLYIGASNEANYWITLGVHDNMWGFAPDVNTYVNLGTPNKKWSQIYSKNSSISTSDRTEKKNIETLDPDKMTIFINALDAVSYKFINGESGRTHHGMIAQQVEEAMAAAGMTDMDFAGYIKSPKYVDIEKEDGTKENVKVEGEYTYGLRYEEFIAPLISVVQQQQKTIKSLEERLATLEALVLEKG